MASSAQNTSDMRQTWPTQSHFILPDCCLTSVICVLAQYAVANAVCEFEFLINALHGSLANPTFEFLWNSQRSGLRCVEGEDGENAYVHEFPF